MIEAYQGETLKIKLTIINEAGETQTDINAVGVFAYTQNSVTIEVVATITAGIFEVELAPATTKEMIGRYDTESKIKDTDDNDIGVIQKITMEILKSTIPNYIG